VLCKARVSEPPYDTSFWIFFLFGTFARVLDFFIYHVRSFFLSFFLFFSFLFLRKEKMITIIATTATQTTLLLLSFFLSFFQLCTTTLIKGCWPNIQYS
jgi:hypothetical protein